MKRIALLLLLSACGGSPDGLGASFVTHSGVIFDGSDADWMPRSVADADEDLVARIARARGIDPGLMAGTRVYLHAEKTWECRPGATCYGSTNTTVAASPGTWPSIPEVELARPEWCPWQSSYAHELVHVLLARSGIPDSDNGGHLGTIWGEVEKAWRERYLLKCAGL
jgi:hypothetical protein